MSEKRLKIALLALLVSSIPCLAPSRALAGTGCDSVEASDPIKDLAAVRLARTLAPALPGNLDSQVASIGLVQAPLAAYAPISQDANWSGIQGGPDFLLRPESAPVSWQPRRSEAAFAPWQPELSQPRSDPHPRARSKLAAAHASRREGALVGFSATPRSAQPAVRAELSAPELLRPHAEEHGLDDERPLPGPPRVSLAPAESTAAGLPARAASTSPVSLVASAPLSDQGSLVARILARNPSIPREGLEQALAFKDRHRDRVRNDSRLAVIDMDKPSIERRLFLIDLRTGNSSSYLTTHGVGSGEGMWATQFSNRVGSMATSLGGYITHEIFRSDKTGVSLKMEGLDPTNNRSLDRGVWIHNAQGKHGVYVNEQLAGRSPAGHSEGCLAVDPKVLHDIIDPLQGGSVVYVYSSRGAGGRTLARASASRSL